MNGLKPIKKYSDLSTEFRLSEINKIKDYFESEIKEQKTIIKKLSKFVTSFNYIDKMLIVLNATFGGVSILSHANDNTIGKYIGLVSSILIGVIKKLLIDTKKNKKKHSKIVILASSGLNKVEILISKALIDLKIDNEEFTIIVDEKEKYDKIQKIKMILVKMYRLEKIFFYFCAYYKMVVISTDNYVKAGVNTIKIKNEKLF